MLQGHQKILIHSLRLLIAQKGPQPLLLLEALPLLDGVIELSEGVGDLHPAGKGLEALHQPFVIGLPLRQGRELNRVVQDEGRLNQIWLDIGGDELVNEFCPAQALIYLQSLMSNCVTQ